MVIIENASPPPPPDAELTPPEKRSRFAPSIEGGYNYQTLYGVPINGFDLMGVLGWDLPVHMRMGLALGFAYGKTDGNLNVTTATAGPVIEWRPGRFRIGGGLRLGAFDFTRATEPGASVFNLSIGAFARTSIDVFRFGEKDNEALYLVVKGAVDSVGTPLWGFDAGLGVRF
jgi:hypothetical protein